MATEIRISELTPKGASIEPTDLIEISESDGLGGYVTKSISGSNLLDTNIYNTDGTLSSNRTVDCDGNTLSFENGTVFIFEALNAPTGGDASFNINGYGTTSSDVVHRISSQLSVITESYGDGSTVIYGNTSIGSNLGLPFLLQVDGSGSGLRGIYAVSSGLIAVTGVDLTNVGVRGVTDSGSAVQGESTTGVAGRFITTAGISSQHVGKVLIEPTATSVNSASAILEVNSTTQGALMPRMTTTQKNSISSPADFLEVIDITLGRKEYYDPFWGWHPVGNITPDWGMYVYEKPLFINGNWAVYNSVNGGLNGANLLNAAISPQRVSAFSTGTNVAGEYRRNTVSLFLGSTGKKGYKTSVSFDTLSDATNRYVAVLGFVGSFPGLTAVTGYGFCYDEGGVYASATASPNWLCISRAAGAYTVVDSGIPVTTTASGAMQKLEVRDDGTGAHIEFFINGASVGVITTNVPTDTQVIGIGEKIAKQAGTTSRSMYVDYSEYKEKFNTPR